MSIESRYQWLKSRGICPNCAMNKPEKGYVHCLECRIKLRGKQTEKSYRKQKKKMQRRHEKGKCVQCGKPVCERSSWFCEKHYLRRLELQRAYRKGLKAHDLPKEGETDGGICI